MDRRQLDMLVPMVFGLAVVVSALLIDGTVAYVAVIGGILVGIYFAVFRGNLPVPKGGRERNRARNR